MCILLHSYLLLHPQMCNFRFHLSMLLHLLLMVVFLFHLFFLTRFRLPAAKRGRPMPETARAPVSIIIDPFRGVRKENRPARPPETGLFPADLTGKGVKRTGNERLIGKIAQIFAESIGGGL